MHYLLKICNFTFGVVTFVFSLEAKACARLEKWEEALESIKLSIEGGAYPKESAQLKEIILEKMQGKKEEEMDVNSKEIVSSVKIAPKELKFYDDYIQWVKKQGADFGKLALKYFSSSYRGISAKQDIKKDDIIVYVPKEAMITLKTARNGPIGTKIVSSNLSMIYPNNSTLSTYVLTEMIKPDSKWAFLFKSFPQSVSNFPLFFSQAELKLLQGSPMMGTFRFRIFA